MTARGGRCASSPSVPRRSSPFSTVSRCAAPRSSNARAWAGRLGTSTSPAKAFRSRVPTACRCRAGRRCSRRSATVPTRSSLGLAGEIRKELAHLDKSWPSGLPQGVIHADLFPDNVFFLGQEVSGLIDFYFACNDMLAYDIAICLNAWCFESDASFNVTKARAFLQAYEGVRPLSADELAALPTLARGAALRFLLTRSYDWLNTDGEALVKRKNPNEYLRKLQIPSQGEVVPRLRARGALRVEREAEGRDPHRRRLLRQSGAWRLGRHSPVGPAPQGAERRRRAHHQQSHGADGGDLGAGGAEVSRRTSISTPTRTISAAASPAGSRAGSATAGAPPTRSRCAISSCGSGSSRQPSGITCAGIGSRAITAMTRTSAPTSSRARAWPRSSRTASATD